MIHLILNKVGPHRIPIVRLIRDVAGVGLKEANDIYFRGKCSPLTTYPIEEEYALKAIEQFEAMGCEVQASGDVSGKPIDAVAQARKEGYLKGVQDALDAVMGIRQPDLAARAAILALLENHS